MQKQNQPLNLSGSILLPEVINSGQQPPNEPKSWMENFLSFMKRVFVCKQ